MKCTLLLPLVVLACDDPEGAPSSRGAPQTPPADTSEPSSETSEDGTRAPADPATLTKWDHDLATAWCQASFTCGRNTVMGDLSRGYWPLTSMSACVASYEHMLASPFSNRVPGDYVFDATRATACLAAIVERCDDPIYLPECDDVVDGPVALGGDCRSAADCAGDAYCTGGYEPCTGTCVPRRALGAECDRDYMCSRATGHAVCGSEDGFKRCSAVVTQVVGIGEACYKNGDRSSEERICGDDAYCSWSRETGGICAPRVAVGASCMDGFDPCAAPALCKRTGPVTAVCTVPSYDAEGGAACGPEVGQTCDIFAGLSCVDGQCAKWGDGLEGAACDPTFAMASCATGFYCDDGGHCVSSANGSPCTLHWHCTSEFCDAGTCAPSPACTE